MKLEMKKMNAWVTTIQDKPGQLAAKLAPLSAAGANLDFVIARRSHSKAKTGLVFVSPIRGAKQTAAAKKAKFKQSKSLHGLKVIAPDKPGLGNKITQCIADAGINLRGFSGVAVNKKALFNLAFDSAADTEKANRALKKAAPKM